MRIRIYTVACLLCVPMFANAFNTGTQLYQALNAENAEVKAVGTIYVNAVRDAFMLGFTVASREMGKRPAGVGICFPESGPRKASVDVVNQYLRDNPEKRQENAMMLTAAALTNAFPCK